MDIVDKKVKRRERRLVFSIIISHIISFLAGQTMFLADPDHLAHLWLDTCIILGIIMIDLVVSIVLIHAMSWPNGSGIYAKIQLMAEVVLSILSTTDFFFSFSIPERETDLMFLRMVFVGIQIIILFERGILILYQKTCGTVAASMYQSDRQPDEQ